MVTEPEENQGSDYNENVEQSPAAGDGSVTDTGIEVDVEFFILEGPEGARLQELQAAAIDRTLRALLRADLSKGDPR